MPTAHPDEGVSCESCHSAAESWLRGHTAKRLELTPCASQPGCAICESFYVRANTCVACHQNLDSDIIKAGHPELTFELDGQSVAEPKHWRDDDPSSGLRAWLVGQAVALREMSWDPAKMKRQTRKQLHRWKGAGLAIGQSDVRNQTNLPVIDQPSETTSSRFVYGRTRTVRSVGAPRSGSSIERRLCPAASSRACSNGFRICCFEGNIGRSAAFRRAQRLVLALDRLSNAASSQRSKHRQKSRACPAIRGRSIARRFSGAAVC